MTSAVLLQAAGWPCAAAALLALALLRRRVAARLALVAEASHELRGPLTALSLGLASLARDASPERARRAAALDMEVRRAGLALADLAAAPAGGRASSSVGVVDVGDLLEEARDAWSPVASSFGTRVELERPAEWWAVRGDRVRLAQALGNLVANGIEHGRGPVRLRAVAAGDGGAALRIEVRDAGRGLPGPLPPAGGHARHRGHGLAVAARVARQGGGRLRSERSPGEHTMILELPLADTPPLVQRRAASEPREAAR